MKQYTNNYTINSIGIFLEKIIAYGSGLGSGSSNAGFTLRFLNEYFGLRLSLKELTKIASSLGSDTSFFINNKPAIVEGRGDVSYLLPYKKLYIIVLKPKKLSINTGEAYKKLAETGCYSNNIDRQRSFIKAYLDSDLNKICENMFNSFEFVIDFNEIKEAKRLLKTSGAFATMLSGSGSSVFGLYSELGYKNALNFFKKIKINIDFDFYFSSY